MRIKYDIIFDVLIQDIVLHAKMQGVRMTAVRVNEMLKERGIEDPYGFGEYYDFQNPYDKIVREFLAELTCR